MGYTISKGRHCSFEGRGQHEVNRTFRERSERQPRTKNPFRKGRSGHTHSNSQTTRNHNTPNRKEFSKTNNLSKRSKHRIKRVYDAVPLMHDLLTRSPSETILAIMDPETDFRGAFSNGISKQNLMELMLRILCRVFTCDSMNEQLRCIVTTMTEKNFFDIATNYFTRMQSEESGHKLEEFKTPMRDMLMIMCGMLLKSPISVTQTIGVHAIIQKAINFMKEKSVSMDVGILDTFDYFSDQMEIVRQKSLRNMHILEDSNQNSSLGISHGDFRGMDIYPQTDDLKIRGDQLLQSNIVIGKYRSLHHYLDVQFRLLREDFVRPLRDGINAYLQAATEKKKGQLTNDIRLYHGVSIIFPICGQNGMFYQLKFDVSRLKHVQWNLSKRLIYGSLLCISSDNFRSFSLATVTERNPRLLQKGFVTVQFETRHSFHDPSSGHFIMAETTAYFESYRHVLSGLQNIGPGDLPFEKYIVFCEKAVMPPNYLHSWATFDLRPLVDNNILPDDSFLDIDDDLMDILPIQPMDLFSEKAKSAGAVDLLDPTTWPTYDLLHLDESQFKALHTALTKEFAIIQGPPGTGKTFIGLKIVKAFLHNKRIWSPEFTEHRPLLIVCYTNHALDQFLEGIVKFYKGNVLRIGSRSSSETLKQCSLYSYRQTIRHDRAVSRAVFRGKGRAKSKMRGLSVEINECIIARKYARKVILHERSLRSVMEERHYDELLDLADTSKPADSLILKWLGVNELVTDRTNADITKTKFEKNRQNLDKLHPVEGHVGFEQEQRQLDTDIYHLSQNKKEEVETIEADFRKYFIALDVESLDTQPTGTTKDKWQKTLKQKRSLKRNLQQNILNNDTMTWQEVGLIHNILNMKTEDKWRLYRFWINMYCIEKERVLEKSQGCYENAAKGYNEMLKQEDREIIKRCTVVGMTTTGAARYQTILKEIQPRIVVVEEAAEVLEAHIITSLSKGCEHLVLIGDHKQLRPNPTVFELAKEYKLDVSLFERMVKNGLQFNCLEYQHRMRPEIAELLGLIYDNYRNHEDVSNYENIKGISSNVFFINHIEKEASCGDSKSHSNDFEANYMAALCLFLIKQGYKPEQITVLTMYSGQLFALKKLMPKSQFEGVRVTVVDNYQGEENDIILLSLVRSNAEGKIGFLNIENRICVALSRAKIGMYVVGNFDMLFQYSKTNLWKSLIKHMKEKGLFGNGLKLYCQNHPHDDAIIACRKEDFEKMPDGGCRRKCDHRLLCGHVCDMFCHSTDPKHSLYECKKECIKICNNGHRCTKTCHEACGNCIEQMDKIVPKCGHVQKIPCHVEPDNVMCEHKCQEILSCGHPCNEPCGYPHTEKCKFRVDKIWPCGYKGDTYCHMRLESICPRKCDAILECEHSCNGSCSLCSEGRLHQPCQQPCTKILVCSHECTGICNKCPPCIKPCENSCFHSRCYQPCGLPCQPCIEQCVWECEHYKCDQLCSQPCNRPRCNEACMKILDCGHQCIGLCGEPCPLYCRVCNREQVTEILFGYEDEPDAKFVLMEDCRAKCIIEYTALDRYMDSESDEELAIMLKACPKCKTTIRKSNRYGAIINKTLQDMEHVKKQYLPDKHRISQLERELYTDLNSNFKDTIRQTLLERLKRMPHPKTESALQAIKNQLEVLKGLEQIELDLQTKLGVGTHQEEVQIMTRFLTEFRNWAMIKRTTMTVQEIRDSKCELTRLEHSLKLMLHRKYLMDENTDVDSRLLDQMNQSERILSDYMEYRGNGKGIVEECLNELDKIAPLPGLGINDGERKMILKAMHLPTGHWFKCPKGHVYAIGECGGAMEETRCPDCKATIGGSRHRLNSDNQLASEMDNAQHAHWSEQTNLENYGFQELF